MTARSHVGSDAFPRTDASLQPGKPPAAGCMRDALESSWAQPRAARRTPPGTDPRGRTLPQARGMAPELVQRPLRESPQGAGIGLSIFQSLPWCLTKGEMELFLGSLGV